MKHSGNERHRVWWNLKSDGVTRREKKKGENLEETEGNALQKT